VEGRKSFKVGWGVWKGKSLVLGWGVMVLVRRVGVVADSIDWILIIFRM